MLDPSSNIDSLLSFIVTSSYSGIADCTVNVDNELITGIDFKTIAIDEDGEETSINYSLIFSSLGSSTPEEVEPRETKTNKLSLYILVDA